MYDLELGDLKTGDIVRVLERDISGDQAALNSVVFSPDGRLIATGGKDNLIRLWDTATGKLLWTFEHDSDVNELAFNSASTVLASVSEDATIRFWDLRTGKNLYVLRDFTQSIHHVAFFQNYRKILLGFEDGTFQARNLDPNYLLGSPLDIAFHPSVPLRNPRGDFTKVILKISPDTTRMAVLVNSTVQVWDLAADKLVLDVPEFNSKILCPGDQPGRRYACHR